MTPAVETHALQQVAAAIEATHKGNGRMELRLDPPELGRVSIEFRFEGDSRVTAILSADQQETASLMRRSVDILTRDLASAGFSDISVTVSNTGRDGAQQGFTGQNTTAHGQDAQRQHGQHSAPQNPQNQGGHRAPADMLAQQTSALPSSHPYGTPWGRDTVDIRL